MKTIGMYALAAVLLAGTLAAACAQIAVPNKSEFYLLPTPRKKKKKESDADGEKGEMKEE